MARRDDSLARALDFGEPNSPAPRLTGGAAGLRLAEPGAVLRGPGKYQVLERRRRRAQIAARRTLDALDRLG
jgi:hypothetical protein